MRKIVPLLLTALLLSACSAPKGIYHFDHYDYTKGKSRTSSSKEQEITSAQQSLIVDETTLVASAKEGNKYPTRIVSTKPSVRKDVSEKLKTIPNEEIRELRREVKKYVKKNKKNESVNSHQVTKAGLAFDLKLAAIFGGLGIVLLIIGGSAVLYILGAVSFLVGFYFLFRWLAHP